MIRTSALTLILLFASTVLTSCDSKPALPIVRPEAGRSVDPLVTDYLTKYLLAVEAKPGDAVERGRLGMVYEANTLYDLAAQTYEQAHTLAPRQVFWIHRRACCLQASGQSEEARKLFKRVTDQDPSFAPSWHRLATLALESGDITAASNAALRATDLRPDSQQAKITLAECRLRSDLVEDAITLLDQVLEAQPSNLYAAFVQGRAYQKAGRPESEYQGLITRGTGAQPQYLEDPRSTEIPNHQAGMAARVNYAGTLIDRGNPTAAASMLQTVLKSYPNEYSALVNLGVAQQNLKQFPAAIDNFDKAIGVDPESFRAYLAKASCLILMQQFAPALAAADEACKRGPREWQCYYTRGRAAIILGESLVVQDSLEQAERLAPNNGEIQLALFEYHQRSGNGDVALVKLQRASELSPNNPAIWVNLAMVNARNGDFPKANELVAKAQQLAPNRPEVKNAIERIRQLEAASK